MRFRRVCIIGVGLLGGSIGLALKRRGMADQVVGTGRDRLRLEKAVNLGAIDCISTSTEEGARGADLVIACTPVQQIVESLREASLVTANHALLTDVGSTKSTIVRGMHESGPHRGFVGSHPMAGSDKSGVEHASAELFENRMVLLTPTEQTDANALGQIDVFWKRLGARTRQMAPENHDEAVALVSHLPHLLASALAGMTPEYLLELAAGGWSSTTRVAGGEPELWRQIVEENREPVLRALKNFATIWQQWISAIETNDSIALQRLLDSGKHIRDLVGSRHSSG